MKVLNFCLKIVAFDFCGVKTTCQSYFSAKPYITNMNFVRYSQVWNFTVNVGLNNINLPQPLFAEQGSMILWQQTNGSKLACKSNTSLGDVLWQPSDSGINLISQPNNVAVYVCVYAEDFLTFREVKNYGYYPFPGVYQSCLNFTYLNTTNITNCSVIVSDGNFKVLILIEL